MLRLRPLALLAVLSLAAACGGGGDDDGNGGNGDGGPDDGDDGGGGGGPDAAQADCEPVSGTNLGLHLVTENVEEPVLVTAPPGDPRLFIIEKHGRIRVFKNGALLDAPFLDIDSRVGSAEAPNERGLLGLVFHPDYANNGRFFVYFTETDTGDDLVREFHVGDDPDIADAESETEILTIDDPYANHNGGMMAFGDDGFLYIGTGDGGLGGDPQDRAQNNQSLLGKMLRIDVDNGSPYSIPDDNPFVGDGGGVKEEIFMMGLRNPWRWSFDRQTGDMYIGDVGQGAWEEVDVVPVADQNGANLGWDEVEGMVCFNDQEPVADPDCTLANYTAPVTVYENPPGDDSRSITGGYVYRGSCYPDLVGTYFYGDYVTDQVWTFKYSGGDATAQQEVTGDLDPDGVIDGLSSFGQDAYGELYVVSLRPLNAGLAAGAIYKIVAE